MKKHLMYRLISHFIFLIFSLGVMTACSASNGVVFDPGKAHHGDGVFISKKEPSLFSYMIMRQREEDPVPLTAEQKANLVAPANHELIQSSAEIPRVTWIGHATALVQYRDINYLTDPHLTRRPFKYDFFIKPRYTPPALRFEEIPEIDFIVISHNHFDHLDHRTVDMYGNSVQWYVPLGVKQWFLDRGISPDKVIELDWWESHQFNEDVLITFTPTEHWSRRTFWDTNKSLWGSWAIDIAGFKTWFAGDTGYHDQYFKDIGERLGPFRLAIIPIGAYAPRYFMKEAHVNPAEAVQVHREVKSAQTLPIHWATFELTLEPFLEPPELLRQEMEKQGLPQEQFKAVKIGETLILD